MKDIQIVMGWSGPTKALKTQGREYCLVGPPRLLINPMVQLVERRSGKMAKIRSPALRVPGVHSWMQSLRAGSLVFFRYLCLWSVAFLMCKAAPWLTLGRRKDVSCDHIHSSRKLTPTNGKASAYKIR